MLTLHEIPDRDQLLHALADTVTGGSRTGLLLVNVHGFRGINGTFGHTVGDALLLELASRIEDILRPTDRLFRVGGDEFAVLLGELRNPQQMTLAANRISQLTMRSLRVGGHELRIRLYLGGAVHPDTAADQPELLQQADIAIQNARRRETTFSAYEPDHALAGTSHAALESELEMALDEGELELHFQPKIDLRTNRICGAEALARWQSSRRGFISPNEFIPVLEASDLVIPFTDWSLNAALRQCSECRKTYRCLSVAVNLSARVLHHPALVDIVLRAMEIWGTEPGSLILEVTESAMMKDPETCLSTLQGLYDHGVRVSIDDFGTGYSSLAYLKRLPVRELKIDKSFVLGMAESREDEKIARSIADLAHNFDLTVVAEGVENAETLELLKAMGCDQAQGFYMGKPMPGDAMKQWMGESPWGLSPDGEPLLCDLPPSATA